MNVGRPAPGTKLTTCGYTPLPGLKTVSNFDGMDGCVLPPFDPRLRAMGGVWSGEATLSRAWRPGVC